MKILAGPCVLEDRDTVFKIAEKLKLSEGCTLNVEAVLAKVERNAQTVHR